MEGWKSLTHRDTTLEGCVTMCQQASERMGLQNIHWKHYKDGERYAPDTFAQLLDRSSVLDAEIDPHADGHLEHTFHLDWHQRWNTLSLSRRG